MYRNKESQWGEHRWYVNNDAWGLGYRVAQTWKSIQEPNAGVESDGEHCEHSLSNQS